MLSHLSFTANTDQEKGRLNVGIDMGKTRWVMDMLDTADGKHHRYNFTGAGLAVEAALKIKELVQTGREVDVIYEAGRNGFTPARWMRQMGANPTILPVNRLELANTGKKAKSDRLDARSLSERDARAPGFPRVWIPSVDDECRRRMLREKERLGKEIKRANNRILGILERWSIPGESNHLPAAQWRGKLQRWREEKVIIPEFLPELETACIENMVAELEVLEKNLAQWEERILAGMEQQRQEAAARGKENPVDVLMQYRGIGQEIALGLGL